MSPVFPVYRFDLQSTQNAFSSLIFRSQCEFQIFMLNRPESVDDLPFKSLLS